MRSITVARGDQTPKDVEVPFLRETIPNRVWHGKSAGFEEGDDRRRYAERHALRHPLCLGLRFRGLQPLQERRLPLFVRHHVLQGIEDAEHQISDCSRADASSPAAACNAARRSSDTFGWSG
jgi:hypothetical protein